MRASLDNPRRQLSVTQASNRLAEVVHDVEEHGPVELTEDGEAVAVIIALDEYRRLAGERPDSWTAYERFRAETDLAELNIDDTVFDSIRDRSPGRDIVV